jgi:hypothetical protein
MENDNQVPSIMAKLSEQFGVVHEGPGLLRVGEKRYPVASASLEDMSDEDALGDGFYSAEYSIPDERGNLYSLGLTGDNSGPYGAEWRNDYDPDVSNPNPLFVGRDSAYHDMKPHEVVEHFHSTYASGKPAAPSRAKFNSNLVKDLADSRATMEVWADRRSPHWTYHDFTTGERLDREHP